MMIDIVNKNSEVSVSSLYRTVKSLAMETCMDWVCIHRPCMHESPGPPMGIAERKKFFHVSDMENRRIFELLKQFSDQIVIFEPL